MPNLETTPAPVEKKKKNYANLNAAIAHLNKKCVFLLKSSEVAIVPTPAHPELDIYSAAKFSLRFDRKIDGAYLASEWLKSPIRRDAYKVVYEPGKPQFIDGNLNTWVPSPVKPKKGDLSRFHAYIDHMFKSDPTHKDWFLAWFAYPLQNPGVKLGTACVFWSRQTGNGKTTFATILRKLYGMHNSAKIVQRNLTESHNSWAQRKQIVVGEEIKSSTSGKEADETKVLITSESITINPKHVQQYEIRDTINYYFSSNHDKAFNLDNEDRRFFVHEVTEDKGSDAFWKAFYAYLENGGYEAILYFLLNDIDLAKPILYEVGEPLRSFSPNAAAPESRARKAMIEAVQDEADEWIRDLTDAPEHMLQVANPALSTSETLFTHFFKANPHTKIKPAVFTSKLTSAFHRLYNGNPVRLANGTRKRVYILAGTANEWEAKGSTAIQVALAQISGESFVPPLCQANPIN